MRDAACHRRRSCEIRTLAASCERVSQGPECPCRRCRPRVGRSRRRPDPHLPGARPGIVGQRPGSRRRWRGDRL